VAQLSLTQAVWRGRIETGLRLAAPALDLTLAARDRLSRAIERDDHDPVLPPLAGRDPQRALADGHH
jgi:hypothetical protein